MDGEVISKDQLPTNTGEFINGLVTNGVQGDLNLGIYNEASINFDEWSNSNSNNEVEHDPLTNATSDANDVTNFASIIEPLVTKSITSPPDSNATEDNENLNTDHSEGPFVNSFIDAEGFGENGFVDDVPTNDVDENLDTDHVEDADQDRDNEEYTIEVATENIDTVVTKEEPIVMDFNEFESRLASNSLTISNVFTEPDGYDEFHNETAAAETVEQSFNTSVVKCSLSSLNRESKKIVKTIAKQARTLTSPEYLWLIIQLVPKCVITITEEQKQIEEIVGKRVSELSRNTVDNVLEQTKNFTLEEYTVLFQKISNKRHKDQSACIREYSQSIMWFKTHLEVEPEHIINKPELYNSYISYCNAREMIPLKSTEFMSLLRNVFPAVRKKRRDSKGVKRTIFINIKIRTALHQPRLPKFAEDQLHNNVLLAQYMSCHDCCSLHTLITTQKSPHPGRPKLKIKLGLHSKPGETSSLDSLLNDSSLVVDDPLDLFAAISERNTDTTKEKIVEVVDLSNSDEGLTKVKRQVAKKSVFSKRIKRVPSKFREYTQSISHTLPSTSKPSSDKLASSDYSDKLLNIKKRLSKFVITKTEFSSKYKVSCTSCKDVSLVSERHGQDLLSAQHKLLEVFGSPKRLPKWKRKHHSSVKRLYGTYENIILPDAVLYDNIEPSVSINRFEVYDWFKNEISTLKRKLLESALNALNTNSRRSRYELKAPINSSNIISHTPSHAVPQHPPIYISAVRETPKPKEPEPPKIAEVYIKDESRSVVGRKRQGSREPEVIEISAQKKPKPSTAVAHPTPLNTIYSRNRHMPYNRRKEADFIYFPAIDTSPNNLRLANLGTLYKCILCLMLFNTEQKLADHEKAHLFCHKCRRKLRTVDLMREHLIKHCQRNFRKHKPILKIHRVDSIAIMVKKYGDTFEASRSYYNDIQGKPKKKFREMIRPKAEPSTAAPPVEEVFVNDIKPDVKLLNETLPDTNISNTNVTLEMILDVKPQQTVISSTTIPATTEMPVLGVAPYEYTQQMSDHSVLSPILINSHSEPPQLIPIASADTKMKANNSTPLPTRRQFKIRIKDLIELS